MRKAKSCSHLLPAHHASGTAISIAIPTNCKKFFATSKVMLLMFAPSTLLMPISFVRCTVVKAASPNKPRQASIIARPAATENKADVRCSAR